MSVKLTKKNFKKEIVSLTEAERKAVIEAINETRIIETAYEVCGWPVFDKKDRFFHIKKIMLSEKPVLDTGHYRMFQKGVYTGTVEECDLYSPSKKNFFNAKRSRCLIVIKEKDLTDELLNKLFNFLKGQRVKQAQQELKTSKIYLSTQEKIINNLRQQIDRINAEEAEGGK